ncbi:MAG: M1 family metallopeptidase [Anaerolineae bacterium]|nr:M1 family metallopeptidase [Anaerolineae bacterium]
MRPVQGRAEGGGRQGEGRAQARTLQVKGSIRHARLLLALLVTCSLLTSCAPGDEPPPAVPTATPLPTATPTPLPPPVGEFPAYALEMALDSGGRRLAGHQVVTYPNHTGDTLLEIVFRLYPNLPQYGGRMSVGEVRVDGEAATTVLRAGDTALAVTLPEPLPAERAVEVAFDFQVEIPVVEAGYALLGLSQGVWSLPDAYALLAVYERGRWHEDVAPAHGDAVFVEAALYDVTLALPPDLVLVATGEVAEEARAAGGERVYHVAGGPLREFAWLASAGYQVIESAAGDTAVRSYYLPGDQAAGEAALNAAVASLRVYEERYGAYPFDTMDVVEAPLMHYGMEYPGLNLIGLDLYREQRAQLQDRVVHEVAHQWWYAQVGNDQVNTPWLDEGLAEYSMAIYYGQAEGEARANTLVNQRWLVPYQVAVENGYDRVVNQPSSAFSWEYEVIVYAKAALFFHALHDELGDDLFFMVLRTYVDRYRWKVARPEDFLAVAESVSGRDLDELYSRWILTAQ